MCDAMFRAACHCLFTEIAGSGAPVPPTQATLGFGLASTAEGLRMRDAVAADTVLDERACDLVQRLVAVCPGARVVESDGARLELAIPRWVVISKGDVGEVDGRWW